MKRALVFLLAFCLVFVPVWVHAGWLDDWFDQYISGSPDYFEGQKRGFISAGTFSARWRAGGSQPLLSIELPHFRSGCGGIDVFLGGMSFAMLPEYIVQKLQALISAAPAIAFEVALSVLSEKLSDKADTVQKAVDMLNSIQLDECQITKGVKVFATKLAEGETFTEAWAAFRQESGLEDLWHKATKDIKGEPVTGEKIRQLTEGCPAEIRELVDAGSLVRWALSRAGFRDAESFARHIRAFMGDVVGRNGRFVYLEPCPQVRTRGEGDIGGLLGEVRYVMDEDGRCYADSSPIRIGGKSYSSLERWAQDNLMELTEAIRKRTPLSEQTEAFARIIPASLYHAVKVAALADSPSGTLAGYARLAAAATAFRILSTVHGSGLYAVMLANRVFESKAAQKENCQIQILQSFVDATNLFLKNAQILTYSARQQYLSEMSEMVSTLDQALASLQMVERVVENIAEAMAEGKKS